METSVCEAVSEPSVDTRTPPGKPFLTSLAKHYHFGNVYVKSMNNFPQILQLHQVVYKKHLWKEKRHLWKDPTRDRERSGIKLDSFKPKYPKRSYLQVCFLTVERRRLSSKELSWRSSVPIPANTWWRTTICKEIFWQMTQELTAFQVQRLFLKREKLLKPWCTKGH